MRYFGTTINETSKALTFSPHLGSKPDKDHRKKDKQVAIVRIFVSVTLIVVGIFLIVIPKKITEGVSLLTLVAGYWLK